MIWSMCYEHVIKEKQLLGDMFIYHTLGISKSRCEHLII